MSTMTTSRPAVPGPAPEGQHWVPEEVPAAQYRPAGPDDTCRYRGPKDPKACGDPAMVLQRHGVTRINWWARCQAHSGGLWLEEGRICRWKLEPLP